MKSIITVFAFFVLLNANAGNNKIKLSEDSTTIVTPNEQLDNGFLLKNGIGILSSNYGFPKRVINSRYNAILPQHSLGIEIGNYWYVWRDSFEKMGIAINVNWFDLQIATNSNDIASATVVNVALNELGPVFTYTLGENAAFDFYFNTRINVVFSDFNYYDYYYYNSTNYQNYDSENYSDAGLGLTYAIGANFRWQILLIGIEYDFGNINITNDDYNNNYRERINMSMFKVMLGLKF